MINSSISHFDSSPMQVVQILLQSLLRGESLGDYLEDEIDNEEVELEIEEFEGEIEMDEVEIEEIEI